MQRPRRPVRIRAISCRGEPAGAPERPSSVRPARDALRALVCVGAALTTVGAAADGLRFDLEPLIGHQIGRGTNTLSHTITTPILTTTTTQKDRWPTSGWLVGGKATASWDDGHGYRTGGSISVQGLTAAWGKGESIFDLSTAYGCGMAGLNTWGEESTALQSGEEPQFRVAGRGLLLDSRGIMTVSDSLSELGDVFSEWVFGYRLAHHDLEARLEELTVGHFGTSYLAQLHRAWHHVVYSGMGWRVEAGPSLDIEADVTFGPLLTWVTDGNRDSESSSDASITRRSYGVSFSGSASPRLGLPLPYSWPFEAAVGLNLMGELRWAPLGGVDGADEGALGWPHHESKHRAAALTLGLTGAATVRF